MFIQLTLLVKNKVDDNKFQTLSKSILLNADGIGLIEPFPIQGVGGAQISMINGSRLHVKETKNEIGKVLGVKLTEDAQDSMEKILEGEKALKAKKKKVTPKAKKKKK